QATARRQAQPARGRGRRGAVRALAAARLRGPESGGGARAREFVAVTNGRPVVALRALGLGDLLTGVPALRALADAFPGHPVLLACPGALAPLAPRARLSGAGDEVGPTAGLADGPLRPRLHHATVAVNLHGRGPESHQLLLATAPERLGGVAPPPGPPRARGPRR